MNVCNTKNNSPKSETRQENEVMNPKDEKNAPVSSSTNVPTPDSTKPEGADTVSTKSKTESDNDRKITTMKDTLDHKECITDEDTICGFGSFRPKWIQKYATPRIFFLFYSIVGVFSGIYYSYVVSIISTLEKRYAFKSKISGVLLLSDEVTPLFLGVILGYIATRSHRPRLVALGTLSAAVCSFLSGLPYLFYGTSNNIVVQDIENVTSPDLCVAQVNLQQCDVDNRPPTMTVVGIFIVASFLKGFSNVSYHVVGIPFVDDNIRKKNTPMYLAVAFTLRELGPLLAFLMSSGLLKIYENPFEDPGFGPDDPRWIGAWWIGFFLQAIVLVIIAIPLALFPRALQGQKKLKVLSFQINKESIRSTLRDFGSVLKRLGKNPVVILWLCNTTVTIYGHAGHSIMLPKYMENQFRMSAADASLYSGASSILCFMISTLLGGFLIWKYRPSIKAILSGMMTAEIILCLSFLVLMIPRCETIHMLNFGVNDNGLILKGDCNKDCDCSTSSFTPFCNADSKTTYFSACHAGCNPVITDEMPPKGKTVFENCSCVSGTNLPESNSSTITEGFCPDENCWSKAVAYLIILFISLTVGNIFTVVHIMILLRSVSTADKSVALGISEAILCLFGFIPFPIVFGALVDSACLVWEESCEETGNCWFYDLEKYNYLLHGTSAVFCFLSATGLATMYFFSSGIRDLYVEEDGGEERVDDVQQGTLSQPVTKL